ncbi:hypothetical protein M3Y99_01459900 [Aphelenchoides fujianensis]|nr:hypothetical protein M3Y99_01459900 [Aphelenchoides fujianensis]
MVKELCCCGMHVHKGAFIIAIISIVFDVLNLFGGVFTATSANNATLSFYNQNTTANGTADPAVVFLQGLQNRVPVNATGSILLNVLSIIFAVVLIVGIKKRKPAFYWPFLVWTALGVILAAIVCVILFVASIVLFVNPDSFEMKHSENVYAGVITLVVALIVLLAVAIKFYFMFHVPNRSRQVMVEDLRLGGGVTTPKDYPNYAA